MSPDEWREVKTQVDILTFRWDILGKLPPEIACFVAENLPLGDIIRLRRVSRRWQQVLSAPSSCRAAAQATFSQDLWAHASDSSSEMDTAAPGASTSASIISSDALAPANTPGSVLGFASDSTPSFDKIAQKRHRLEQGIPYRVTESPSPIFGQILPEDTDVKAVVTYSKGSCAWLGMNDNQTTVMVLNLANTERKIFTTDNREKLCTLHFSKPYIAAVSIRGYCHV
ncbi:uncharacterized protein N7458_000399 [Penicillium daleae]|uniref:F-box domain-containing protein n=1 Tax=Penicillium daleae TaxID=63821 RepID=A0AAD6G7D6_9EURO|nr:uncharacterized protein N7458_000399 [Penicillium daleae]KAJ5464713.1 hypothetical protein N7458_000399 [Penicillium daleae]